MVSLEGEKRPLYGYIQDIDEPNQLCIVYIDALCEKRSVPIGCMRPLNVSAYEPKKFKGGKDDRKYNTFGIDKRACDSLNRSSNYSDIVIESCQCRSDFCDVIYKTDNLNQFTNISNFQNPRNSYEIVAYPIQYTANAQNMGANPNNTAANAVKNTKNRNSSGQNHGHVVVQPTENVQQVTIMKNDDKTGHANNKIHHEQKPNDVPVSNNSNQHQQFDQQQSSGHGTRESSIEPAQSVPMNQYSYSVRNGTHVYYPPCEFTDQPPSEMVPNQPFFVVPPNYSAAPVPGYAPHTNQVAAINYVPMQYGQWPAYNPQGMRPSCAIKIKQSSNFHCVCVTFLGYVHAPAQPIPYAVQPPMPIIRSDLMMSHGRPNYNANYSFSPMADDLSSMFNFCFISLKHLSFRIECNINIDDVSISVHDQYTIRFYFNLGVEYWKQLQSIHGAGPLMAMIDGEAFEQASSEVDSQHNDAAASFQQITLEDSITTPTPPKGNVRLIFFFLNRFVEYDFHSFFLCFAIFRENITMTRT